MKATFDTEQKMVEQMSGRWIMELPELSTIHRSDIEDVKAFLGEKKSIVRLAYGKRSQTFMRQCIFGGTTNKEKYLVDDQNRRYWPIYCDMPGDQEIDTDRLRSEIGQFWAEAVSIYREWRKAQPKGELPLYLTNADSRMIALTQQEEHRVETAADILAGEIEAWLDTPVRASKIMPEFADIKEGLPDPLVYRMKSCTRQIWQEALGKTVTPNHHETLLLGDAIGKLTGWRRASTATFPGYGKQRAIRRVGASPDDDVI